MHAQIESLDFLLLRYAHADQRVANLEKLPPGDRLDAERVVKTIQDCGIPAFYEPQVDDILHRVKPLAKPGDVIVVFSNGGFGGIHERLLTELAVA